MCEECDCEVSVQHGLETIVESIRNDILEQLCFVYWKCYEEPKKNRELLREYGTLHPTWEQVISKHPDKLIAYNKMMDDIVGISKKEVPLFNLIPMERIT